MRLFGQTLTAVTAIGLSLVIAPACVDNDQSIYIRQVMAPPQGQCLYTPDPSQPALLEGAVDVALTDNYRAVMLVGNQMISRSDNLAARTETNKAHIDGAVVRVTDANGNSLGEFTSEATGFADSATGNIASYGLMLVTLIDKPTLASIAGGLGGNSKVVLANVKVFGETLGGDDLESGEFQFTVRVCSGCLISFTGADDPLTPGVDCNLSNSAAAGSSGAGGQVASPCILGQDQVVPCTSCRTDNPACRSR